MSSNELYWDLMELNPKAIIYTEYEEAYIGFANKDSKTWVAVYDAELLSEQLMQQYFVNEEFIEGKLKEADGKIKESELQHYLATVCSIEANNFIVGLSTSWIPEVNAPLMLFSPKVISETEKEDRIFRYTEKDD